MKTIIIYNTRSGNTELLAKKMKEILEKYGHECQIFRDKAIKSKIKSQPNFCESYELICLGSPVHAAGPAFSFRKFLKTLSKLNLREKKLIIFATSGSPNMWKTTCEKIQKKIPNTKSLGIVGCIRRENESAIKDFDAIITNLK